MKKWLILFAFVTLLLTACSSKEEAEKEINLLNWSEYMPQSVLDQFEEEYGIKVNYSEMSSNEEMLAKISAGGSGYDITVATDYMVDIMLKQDLLEKFDKSQLTNLTNIGDEFLTKEFDPAGDYFVPYMWGNAVIAVNSDKINFEVNSFKDLWRPEFKNGLVVPDDMRSFIGVANKVQGKSINETDVAVLEESKRLLVELQPNIKAYDSDSPKTMLVNGEALAGIVYGGEASLARQENPAIVTVLPSEGMELWQDNFVIPKGAPHKKEAELFINFILRPEVSAEISKEFPYANPNLAAHEFIDASILADPAVYTPASAMEKSEFMTDLGEATRDYDRIWSEIKQ